MERFINQLFLFIYKANGVSMVIKSIRFSYACFRYLTFFLISVALVTDILILYLSVSFLDISKQLRL